MDEATGRKWIYCRGTHLFPRKVLGHAVPIAQLIALLQQAAALGCTTDKSMPLGSAVVGTCCEFWDPVMNRKWLRFAVPQMVHHTHEWDKHSLEPRCWLDDWWLMMVDSWRWLMKVGNPGYWSVDANPTRLQTDVWHCDKQLPLHALLLKVDHFVQMVFGPSWEPLWIVVHWE